jgi:hypothetical protein
MRGGEDEVAMVCYNTALARQNVNKTYIITRGGTPQPGTDTGTRDYNVEL